MHAPFRFAFALVASIAGAVVALAGCRWIMGADELTYVPADGGDGGGTVDEGSTPLADGAAGGHVSISAELYNSTACATRDGVLYCWGSRNLGTLGFDGGSTDTPTLVPGPDDGGTFVATQVGVQGDIACALRGGLPYCWGFTEWGHQASSGGPTGSSVVFTRPVTEVTEIAVGGTFACARTASAELYCWGDHGQALGYGQLTSDFDKVSDAGFSEQGVPVDSLKGLLHVAAGDTHACAVRADGSVVCWGNNDHRQTGSATSDACTSAAFPGSPPHPCVRTPTPVNGLSRVVKLALSAHHSCALDADAHVFCWGANESTQLGDPGAGTPACTDDGTDASAPLRCSETPVHVAAMDGATSIAVGGSTSCAVKGGQVYCWGDNQWNALGRAGPNSSTPVAVALASGGPLTNVAEIAVGDWFVCAMTADLALFCWGDDIVKTPPMSIIGAHPVPW
jgi:alpha-tubulin suppressor-like RCC1 family protein